MLRRASVILDGKVKSQEPNSTSCIVHRAFAEPLRMGIGSRHLVPQFEPPYKCKGNSRISLRWGRRQKGLPVRNTISIVMILGLEVFFLCPVILAQVSRRDAGPLSQASLIYIATVRKDGNQSKAAPVWFTTTPEGLIYIQTAKTTWKAKRIHRGSPVIVWIGKRDGPAFIGKAQITNDLRVSNQIVTDYPQKYLLARLGFHRPTREMFDSGQILAIIITPVRDLPTGYTSQPGTPAPKLTEEATDRSGTTSHP
jgi:hypothetical protein